jgi:hypothetical protein
MIYRTAAVFIVLFWLTMTALLVHQEVRPGDSAFREIPPSHVVKLFFMRHQEPHPPLSIYSDKLRIGELRIVPAIDEKTQDHSVEFQGSLQVSIFGGKRERIGWKGVLKMDKLLTVKRFELEILTHSPTDLTTDLVIIPGQNLAHYELKNSTGTVERHDYTLDERGARLALEQAGFDMSLLPISYRSQTAEPVSVKARLSTLAVHGGQMDTFLVTMESNGQTLFECDVDQLGRIVHASTLLGYTLTPTDDGAP